MSDLKKLFTRVPPNPRGGFGEAYVLEGLWARQVGVGLYQLDSVPAFEHQLNYLDVVRAHAVEVSKEGSTLEIIGIHRRGGQMTFDLHFHEAGWLSFGKKRLREALISTVKEDLNGHIERVSDTWVVASVDKARRDEATTLFGEALYSEPESLLAFSMSGTGDRWSGRDW